MKTLSKKGWQFVAVTLALSAIPYFFIVKAGDPGSSWTLLLMWVPGIASVIMRLIHKEGLFSEISWNPFKAGKWIVLAAFIPFVIEILTITLSVLTGSATLKENFITWDDGTLAIKGMALLFGASAQPWYIFLPNFVLSYFVGMVLYSVLFAMGEEFGWRGYLQKEWAVKPGLKALFIIGIIWGWWHLPGILLGHNYPDYPMLGGFILMPMVTTLFSIAFGVAYAQSGRVIWVPVLFHGAVNISAEISNVGLVEASIHRPMNDFIWTALWGIAAVVIWRRWSR